jgi:hypothetical protein
MVIMSESKSRHPGTRLRGSACCCHDADMGQACKAGVPGVLIIAGTFLGGLSYTKAAPQTVI